MKRKRVGFWMLLPSGAVSGCWLMLPADAVVHDGVFCLALATAQDMGAVAVWCEPELKPKHVDLCGQVLCIEDATHAMYWPGRGRMLVCESHKAKAEEIAKSMGFELTIEPCPENDAGPKARDDYDPAGRDSASRKRSI